MLDEGWIWGLHAVAETLTSAPRTISTLYVAGNRRSPEVTVLTTRAAEAGVEVRESDVALLDDLSQHGKHQGVVARTGPFPYVEEGQLRVLQQGLLVALDCVQDPRNLGAILRTAHAAGAAGLLLPKDRSAGVTAAAVRSAGGYVHRVPVARVTNLARTLGALGEEGWWVIGLVPGARRSIWEVQVAERTLLVVGGEGGGLRPLVASSCQELAGIPMVAGVESLNASVAAGIALYELGMRRSVRPRSTVVADRTVRDPRAVDSL